MSSKNHKRIYIDFDDVLSQTALKLLQVVKDQFNKSISYEAIISFDLQKSFELTQNEWKHLMQLAHSNHILLDMEIIPGAHQALNQLHSDRFEIHIVTGRPPTCLKDSTDWLAKQDVPFHEIHFVDKYLRFKGQYQNALTLDELVKRDYLFAIEDSAAMAQFVSEKMQIPVFLLDRPWNQALEIKSTESLITRCKSWPDLLNHLKSD